MRVTPAYLESIASFYDMLELEPAGRHIVYVCTNIPCQLRGARDVLDAFAEATGSPVNGTSPDGEFRVRSFECLGACDIAPMASIDGHYRGPLDPEDAKAAADHLRGGGASAEVLPEKRHLEKPSAGKPANGFGEGAPNPAAAENPGAASAEEGPE
jgi:hypothetical protein